MSTRLWARGIAALLVVAAFVVTGCVRAPDKAGKDAAKDKPAVSTDKHEGWWCTAHGIPEDECSMCNPKMEAELKKKGDWCKEHDRVKSQCFFCDPKLREVYAAKHRAKLGTEPPSIPEIDDKDKKDKK